MIKVLVIEDDFMVAKVHSGFVNSEPGFSVVGVAHTASQALDAVAALAPDLALLDIYLPDANGLDLLAQLREVHPELDVIVISAARELDTVRRALRGGIIHYLMKPFSREDLKERLDHYRSTYREPGRDTEQELDQSDVDRLLGRGSRQRRPLPKGCSVETLGLVERILRTATEPLSASDTAVQLGTSRVSARRYLEHLAEEGTARVNLRYGGVGRPERLYSWGEH